MKATKRQRRFFSDIADLFYLPAEVLRGFSGSVTASQTLFVRRKAAQPAAQHKLPKRYAVRVLKQPPVHRRVAKHSANLFVLPHQVLKGFHGVFFMGQHLFVKTKQTTVGEIKKQEKFIEAGVENVKDYDEFLLKSAVEGVKHAPSAAKREARGVYLGMFDLVKLIVGDIWHGIRYAGLVVWNIVTSVAKTVAHLGLHVAAPFIVAGKFALSPIGKIFAQQAKQEALDEITTTPNHKSYMELAILVVAALGIIGAAGYFVATGGNPQISVKIDVGKIVDQVAGFSPSQLTLLGAVLIAFIGLCYFWVLMLKDSWTRDYETNIEKTKWKLTTGLFFIPGAFLYFFNVYNRWSFRQFLGYHFASTVSVAAAVVVLTSTYGTLIYFNQKAEASIKANDAYQVPNLELSPAQKALLENRAAYGAPLAPGVGGKVDPFAPIPNATGTAPSPSPSPSPSPTP